MTVPHDHGHFNRVWKTARYINQQEGRPADELNGVAHGGLFS